MVPQYLIKKTKPKNFVNHFHIFYKLFASYMMTFRKNRCVCILSNPWWHPLGCIEKSYTAMHVATNTSEFKGSVLVSAAIGNKSTTRPPLPPPRCGGEWKENR